MRRCRCLLVALHVLAAVVISAPLVYAATAKALASQDFLASLVRLRLGVPVGAHLVGVIAACELALAFCVLTFTHAAPAVGTAAVYSAFALIVLRAVRLGARGDCGCFGALTTEIDLRAAVRNLALAVGSAALALARWTGALVEYPAVAGLVTFGALALAAVTLDTVLTVRRARRRT